MNSRWEFFLGNGSSGYEAASSPSSPTVGNFTQDLMTVILLVEVVHCDILLAIILMAQLGFLDGLSNHSALEDVWNATASWT